MVGTLRPRASPSPRIISAKVTARLNAYAAERLQSPDDLTPTLAIDAVAALPELTQDFYEFLTRLEPFGKDNRRPLFASQNVSLLEVRTVGHSRQHLRFRVEQGGREMTALAFGQVADWPPAGWQPGATGLDLAYTLMLDTWQGYSSLALRVSHFRAAASG